MIIKTNVVEYKIIDKKTNTFNFTSQEQLDIFTNILNTLSGEKVYLEGLSIPFKILDNDYTSLNSCKTVKFPTKISELYTSTKFKKIFLNVLKDDFEKSNTSLFDELKVLLEDFIDRLSEISEKLDSTSFEFDNSLEEFLKLLTINLVNNGESNNSLEYRIKIFNKYLELNPKIDIVIFEYPENQLSNCNFILMNRYINSLTQTKIVITNESYFLTSRYINIYNSFFHNVDIELIFHLSKEHISDKHYMIHKIITVLRGNLSTDLDQYINELILQN